MIKNNKVKGEVVDIINMNLIGSVDTNYKYGLNEKILKKDFDINNELKWLIQDINNTSRKIYLDPKSYNIENPGIF